MTSDYLYQLDKETGNLTDLEDQPQYQNLTVAPNGEFILADYYNFEKVTTTINEKEQIESLIQILCARLLVPSMAMVSQPIKSASFKKIT